MKLRTSGETETNILNGVARHAQCGQYCLWRYASAAHFVRWRAVITLTATASRSPREGRLARHFQEGIAVNEGTSNTGRPGCAR